MSRQSDQAATGEPLSSPGSSKVPFLLANGFELAITFSLAVVAIIFTLLPDWLAHAPAGFETRGYVHHAWHYMLLVGAVGSFVGLAMARPKVELAGLSLLIGAVAINLITLAYIGREYLPQQGLALAVRLGALVGLCTRAYLLGIYLPRLKEPNAR